MKKKFPHPFYAKRGVGRVPGQEHARVYLTDAASDWHLPLWGDDCSLRTPATGGPGPFIFTFSLL